MSADLRFPLPGGAGTLVASSWIPKPLDGGGDGIEFVDVHWVAEGESGYGTHAGSLASMREAGIALAEIARVLEAGEPSRYDETYAAAGFEAVAPQGLSHTSAPTWLRRIDGRWTAWFAPDDCETSLRLTDQGTTPWGHPSLGTFSLPTELRWLLPYPSAILERALLAVLDARLEAGDPGTVLR